MASGTRRERSLHRSTFTLGDETKTFYFTTHAESFSGRGQTEQEPMYPLGSSSSSPDINIMITKPSYTSTHSRDVHCPKPIILPNVLYSLRHSNRSRNDEGLAMKEVTNPPEATPYTCTYYTHHCCPAACCLPTSASGLPTHWHQHNILTGEERSLPSPKNQARRSGERLLWAVRNGETEHKSLQLY